MSVSMAPDKDQTDVVPEVGKIYHVFNDGKIRLSRHGLEKVVEVIPFKDFQTREDMKELYASWRNNVKSCYWLYSPVTDFIVVTEIIGDDLAEDEKTAYYARTKDKGWFGFGSFLCDGQLDSDRHLWKDFVDAARSGEWFNYDEKAMAEIEELDNY